MKVRGPETGSPSPKAHGPRSRPRADAKAIRQLEAVINTALAHLSLDHLLDELLVRVRTLLGADTAAILLLDGDELVTRAVKGLGEERRIRTRVSGGFAGRVAAEKRPIFVENVEDVDPAHVLHPVLVEEGIRSLLGVPILFEGQVIGVLHVGTRERRQFDRGDAQLLQVVADRIGLGIEYAQLYRKAEESSRLKDEFLATLSHELRTPLTPILAWVSQLRRGTLDPDRVVRALEAIERNARAQVHLVDDLLEVSRIISGKMRLEVKAVRLADVIDAAIEGVRPAAMAKDIRVVKAIHPGVHPIRGDAQRLQQVAWNLLSNAINFTPENGRVELRLRPAGTYLELTVRDTGKGISPAFLPHVFERFRQGDASSRGTHGGLGLGLAIVRHIVELHGGTVHAESAGEGQGATFTVRLPVQVASRQAPARSPETEPPPAPARARLDGLRVLVVDDEPDTCQVLEAILRWDGADVRVCQSAAEALATLAGWWPDILLCDIGMPGEDGYSLLRKIRGLPPGHPLAAVALTAYAGSEDRQQALSAGFQMHVPKPFDPDELVATVASLGRGTPLH